MNLSPKMGNLRTTDTLSKKARFFPKKTHLSKFRENETISKKWEI
jgi:hypothetical protein